MTTRGNKIHRLQLQKRKNTVNSANETIPNPTWEDITYCWASIEPLGGNEYTLADEQNAKLTHDIRVYNIKNKTDQIRSSMRFFDGRTGTVYNIDNYRMQMVQRDREIVCLCIQDESRVLNEGGS